MTTQRQPLKVIDIQELVAAVLLCCAAYGYDGWRASALVLGFLLLWPAVLCRLKA